MIELRNIFLEYNNLDNSKKSKNSSKLSVIEDLSLTINDGEIVALVGPSGCGKSSILNIISNMQKPTKGEVIVSDNVGYMLQNSNLLDWYNILDNIQIGLKIKRKNNHILVDRLITEYGLKDFIFNYPYQLSGGMKQRVALIRTLVTNPGILLLDEPTTSLDFQTKLNVLKEIKNIIKNEKKTTLVVTHDITEALSIADRIIVLTKRPCKIKKEYINNSKNLYDDKFNLILNKIIDDIKDE